MFSANVDADPGCVSQMDLRVSQSRSKSCRSRRGFVTRMEKGNERRPPEKVPSNLGSRNPRPLPTRFAARVDASNDTPILNPTPRSFCSRCRPRRSCCVVTPPRLSLRVQKCAARRANGLKNVPIVDSITASFRGPDKTNASEASDVKVGV